MSTVDDTNTKSKNKHKSLLNATLTFKDNSDFVCIH